MNRAARWRSGIVTMVLLTLVTTSSSPATAASTRTPAAAAPVAYHALDGVHTLTYAVDWDARLCGRYAVLIPAAVSPGQWYWRLVQARWYDEHEPPFDGQHHIFVDVRDAGGARQPGVPVRFSSLDGGQTFEVKNSEAKPGELYALDFPMQAVAPAYRVAPHDGAPADHVSGLGLGNYEHPDWPVHTSYLLVWQWTQANGEAAPDVCGDATPTPAATPMYHRYLPLLVR